jgi:V/A-type H+-transporting ATPase subunit A
MALLQREAELDELVRLVGMDALAPDDRLLLQAAKMIREDFLHQNAFDDRDTFTSLKKQMGMLETILHYYDEARKALQAGADLNSLLKIEPLEEISRAKLIAEDGLREFDVIDRHVSEAVAAVPKY